MDLAHSFVTLRSFRDSHRSLPIKENYINEILLNDVKDRSIDSLDRESFEFLRNFSITFTSVTIIIIDDGNK